MRTHLFKAKSLTSILTKLDLCKYRFGLTGTLDDTQTHRLILEGLFGSVQKVTTTKELIDSGTLADLDINCIVLKHTEEESKNLKGLAMLKKSTTWWGTTGVIILLLTLAIIWKETHFVCFNWF